MEAIVAFSHSGWSLIQRSTPYVDGSCVDNVEVLIERYVCVCVCNMIKTESTDKYLSNRITWQTDV